MNIKIEGTTYELKYGLSFINALDNLYKQDMSGVQFGMGIEMMNTYLELKRPTALANIIKAGTSHLDSKPSSEGIEDYLEKVFIDGKAEDLFEKVKVETEQAPFLKQAMQTMNQAAAKEQKPELKAVTKPTKE